MKNYFLHLSTFKLNPLLLPVMILSSLALSACQKEPEPETVVVVEVESTPVATSISEPDMSAIDEQADGDLSVDRDVDLTALESDIDNASEPSSETTSVSAEQAIKGTQITDVKYRSDTGKSLSVVFETSATGVLNAILTLPNKPKMTLSAPEGEGNNPTYRSKDGKVELVSHGGGSNIDLLQGNEITSYDAVSADAEVVTES